MRWEEVANLFYLVGEMEGIAYFKMCLELWDVEIRLQSGENRCGR